LAKKNRILFRTAGGRAIGKQLGMGHIYRTINLSSYLENSEFNYLVEDYGGVKKILNKKKMKKIQYLKPGINYKEDISTTKKFIKKNNIDLVIIDKYQISNSYIKKLSEFTKNVVITDLKNTSYNSNLVINGFIGFKNQVKINLFGCKCLLGPKFQILNKQFQNKKIQNKKKIDILITLGGFDEKKYIEKLLELLEKYLDKLLIKIILGPATLSSNKVKSFEKKYSKTLIIQKQTKNMRKEIFSCKFGICGGGITSYEFAKFKIPFAIISQVKHQLLTAKEWEKRKYAINLGLFDKKFPKKIENLFFHLSASKNPITISSKPSVIDGFGGIRVAKEIKKLF